MPPLLVSSPATKNTPPGPQVYAGAEIWRAQNGRFGPVASRFAPEFPVLDAGASLSIRRTATIRQRQRSLDHFTARTRTSTDARQRKSTQASTSLRTRCHVLSPDHGGPSIADVPGPKSRFAAIRARNSSLWSRSSKVASIFLSLSFAKRRKHACGLPLRSGPQDNYALAVPTRESGVSRRPDPVPLHPVSHRNFPFSTQARHSRSEERLPFISAKGRWTSTLTPFPTRSLDQHTGPLQLKPMPATGRESSP